MLQQVFTALVQHSDDVREEGALSRTLYTAVLAPLFASRNDLRDATRFRLQR